MIHYPIALIFSSFTLTPVEADRVLRPQLPALRKCLQAVESNRQIHLSFQVDQVGGVSKLNMFGAELKIDDDCLQNAQHSLTFSPQVESIQYVSFRVVLVNDELQLLPDTTVRLPEIILPGIFADPNLKNRLLKRLDE